MVLLAMLVVFFFLWSSESSASQFLRLPSNGGTVGRSRLSGVNLPEWELDTIMRIADEIGVDPRYLAAIRIAENGGPGREFGVLSVSAPTYEEQARVAAISIRNNIGRYESATGSSAIDDLGRLTQAFTEFMANRWAPVGAENDPTSLNRYWPRNVMTAYLNAESV